MINLSLIVIWAAFDYTNSYVKLLKFESLITPAKWMTFLKNNWGVVFLFCLLIIIGWKSFHPQLWLMGWDNFSVNLDPILNLQRTIFATWRDYRGLGVPSDSEVVDVFRIGLFAILSLTVSTSVLVELYYVILYGLGVLSAYWLVKQVLKSLYSPAQPLVGEIAATLSGLFYGFNLHAFETFYLPITMYTARFALFPLFLVVFLKLLAGTNKLRWWLAFVVVTWAVAVTYLTATLFFTLLMCLVLVAVSYANKMKRFLVLLTLFGLLNAFWLLVFGNYYLQKAQLIPLASSFISVNESLLNKPASVFSWTKITTFFPEFLSSQSLPFTDLITRQPVTVHPLVGISESEDKRLLIVLLLPIGLALLGLGLMVIRSFIRKERRGWWVILLVIGTLFLLRKEYPPLGWLYEWLSQTIPLFKIVFRFGSAKFSPLLLIGLTVSFGYFLYHFFTNITHSLPRGVKTILVGLSTLVLVGVMMSPFTGFFSEGLFSRLVLVSVPPAYPAIAETINDDPTYARVVHIPFDEFSYWKSYSWGYMGSSFLNFMLDKPLIERTFEPASLENDYFNLSLLNIIKGSQTTNPSELDAKATRAYALLKKSGVKYVVFDASVGANIPTIGWRAWGVFHEQDTATLVSKLVEKGYLKLVQVEEINLQAIANQSGTDEKYQAFLTDSQLELLVVQEPEAVVESLTEVTNVDPLIDNALIDPLLVPDQHFIQSDQFSMVSFPFWQPQREIAWSDNGLRISARSAVEGQLRLQWPVGEPIVGKSPYAIEIARSTEALKLRFRPVTLGEVSELIEVPVTEVSIPLSVLDLAQLGSEAPVERLSNWHLTGELANLSLRLKVEDQILPLPQIIGETYQPLATTLLSSSSASVSLLGLESENQPLAPAAMRLTDDPNCFQDKQSGYSYEFDNNNLVSLTTHNGMTCLSTPLILDPEFSVTSAERLFELNLDFETQSQYSSEMAPLESSSYLQQQVRASIDTLPTYEAFSVCLLDETNSCLNSRQWVKGNQSASVTIPAEVLTTADRAQLLMTLPAAAGETNQLTIYQAAFSTYVPIWVDEVELPLLPLDSSQTIIAEQESVPLTIPYFMTPTSFYFQDQLDAFNSYAGKCLSTNGYRRLATTPDWPALSYLENCFQGLSTTLPYDSASSYLWLVDYSVLAGKQPKFVARQNQELLNEYVSRFNGYPDVEVTKPLQAADSPLKKKPDVEVVKQIIQTMSPQSASIMVPPTFTQTGSKVTWELSQQGEGQSLVGLKNHNLIELPAQWVNAAVVEEGATLRFAPLEILETRQILPSLWQVTLKAEPSLGEAALLKFGQAYDSQWQVYQTKQWWQAMLGQGELSATHVKVDGWSNGWVLTTDTFSDQPTTLYFFYLPERLAIVGVAISLIAAVGCLTWVGLKRKRAN